MTPLTFLISDRHNFFDQFVLRQFRLALVHSKEFAVKVHDGEVKAAGLPSALTILSMRASLSYSLSALNENKAVTAMCVLERRQPRAAFNDSMTPGLCAYARYYPDSRRSYVSDAGVCTTTIGTRRVNVWT